MFILVEDNSKQKKKGHRPKKFENPSTVISFRADKEKYEQNKELFRSRIETTIKQVTEEIKNKKGINQEGSIIRYFTKKEEVPKMPTIKRKLTPSPKSSKEFSWAEFNLDGEIHEYLPPTQNKRNKPEENEKVNEFYSGNRKDIKEKVRQFIEKQEKEEQEKELSREEIFEEFKEVIDVELDEFKER